MRPRSPAPRRRITSSSCLCKASLGDRMSARLLLLGLVLVAFIVNAGQTLGADSFAEFLNRVERRDSRTKAICAIRTADAKNAIVMHFSKVEVKDKIATFEFSRNYKSGNRVETLQFPVTDEVQLEVRRINSYLEMISLKAKAEAAINAHRVFVASDFRIRVGDTLENADIQMGVTRKEHPNQGPWADRIVYIYEDGLTIECIRVVVQGVWRD